ncbi:MAG: hypothetical protein KJT01_17075 [Gemmatimonadetes bacterium]|nr:hypothetical protein [Gemmatimonadota bacterium]
MVPELLARFALPFHRLGLPYMITGGAAAIVYGEPRLTNDLDLVVAMHPADAARVAAALAGVDTYVPPVEVLEIEAGRRVHGHFNVVHGPSALRADVYVAGEDPLNAWGLAARRLITVEGQAVAIAPPEYVMVRKLQYAAMGGGDRHLRDIHRMLERALVPMDRAALIAHAETLGVRALLARAEGWRDPV